MQQPHKSHASQAKAPGPIFVTMTIDGQLFGIEVRYVRDVLLQQPITPVPLAAPEIAGSLNLRGRIATVIDVRKRLGLAPNPARSFFVVVEQKGELFSLMVDAVGEVITASPDMMEGLPANLGANWKAIASGICKLENGLLVVVDVQSLLHF